MATPTSSPTTAPQQTTSPTQGLSPSARAAIGVGVTLSILSLTFIGFYIWLRRRRAQAPRVSSIHFHFKHPFRPTTPIPRSSTATPLSTTSTGSIYYKRPNRGIGDDSEWSIESASQVAMQPMRAYAISTMSASTRPHSHGSDSIKSAAQIDLENGPEVPIKDAEPRDAAWPLTPIAAAVLANSRSCEDLVRPPRRAPAERDVKHKSFSGPISNVGSMADVSSIEAMPAVEKREDLTAASRGGT